MILRQTSIPMTQLFHRRNKLTQKCSCLNGGQRLFDWSLQRNANGFTKMGLLLISKICCILFYMVYVVNASGFYYTCYPNDTVLVTNPLAYTWFRADSNDSTSCTVTPVGTDIVITGCSKDLPITLIMSNRTDTDYNLIHGLRVGANDHDLYTVVLLCNEIADTGVYRNVTVAITPSIPQTFQQTVSPSFTLTSFIYEDSTKVDKATTANSGDLLYWNIVGPIEYDHKPELCIAYAGLVITPTVSNKTIMVAGCTQDDSLVSDWSFVNGTGNEVYSDIYAFRFFSSPYVTFECKVRVCPSGEPDCVIDCSSERKRRAAERPLTDDQAYIPVRSTIKIETPQKYEIKFGRFLSSESASLESEMWWLLGVAVILKAM